MAKPTNRQRGYVTKNQAIATLRYSAHKLEQDVEPTSLIKFNFQVWLASEDEPERPQEEPAPPFCETHITSQRCDGPLVKLFCGLGHACSKAYAAHQEWCDKCRSLELAQKVIALNEVLSAVLEDAGFPVLEEATQASVREAVYPREAMERLLKRLNIQK